MFTLEMLPAEQGDAIWIEYGEPGTPNRILIDCGVPATAKILRERIERLPTDQRQFELLVVTHIDTDHIGGVLKLLARLPEGLGFDDVWFNAWRHLEKGPSSKMGPIDGEILSCALDKLKWTWNGAFDGGPVMAEPARGVIPALQLRGGMRLSVLSPTPEQLSKLRRHWVKVVLDGGLDPNQPDRAARLLAKAMRKGVGTSLLGSKRPDVERLAARVAHLDAAVANGSSIALLAEYEGARALLTADCFPQVLLGATRQVLRDRGERRLRVDALKIPHHGSRNNVTNDLLATIVSPKYLISTSGAVFGHPDDEAIARIIWANGAATPCLCFNYAKDHPVRGRAGNEPNAWSAAKWDDSGLRRIHGYTASFGGLDGTSIELGP